MSVHKGTEIISEMQILLRSNIAKLNVSYILLLTVCIYLTLWYMKFQFSRRHLNELFAKIPSPANTYNLPFIGTAHHFFGDTEHALNVLVKMCEKGTPIGAHLGEPIVVIHRPEDIAIVLNHQKSLAKHNLYRFINHFTGEGLFTAPVPLWKVHRRAIIPTFATNMLHNFFEVFVDTSEIFSDILGKNVGNVIMIDEKLSNWSLDSICETAIGVKMNAQTTNSRFLMLFRTAFNIFVKRLVYIIYHNDFIFNMTSMAKEQKSAISSIQAYIDKVLQEKYKTREENRKALIENPEAEISEEKKKLAFLDLFIELKSEKGKFTDEEIRNETNTLLLAGSDTTATTTSFIFLILGMFPEVQEKLHAEIIDVMGSARQITLADLPNLKYMERVIKETMRLFPLGALIGRKTEDDIKIDNYVLPKGIGIVIVLLVLHRSPEYWKDPLTFDPDRFLPEEVAKRHPYSYIPFSAGPRSCIGSRYAMMSMKVLLSTVLRKYYVKSFYKSIESIKLKHDLVLRPVDGFPVTFTKRNAQ